MFNKILFSFILIYIVFASANEKRVCSTQIPGKESIYWYTKFSTGYAYSCSSRIYNPDPAVWDQADQGYSGKLGGAPFITAGIGTLVLDCLEVDASYAFFENFHYRSYQTGISQSIGYTSFSRIRVFDLTHQNVMLTATFCPLDRLYMTLCNIETTFYAGYGIGAGFYRAFPFYTNAFSENVGSVTSIGDKKNSAAFAWQALLGIRLHPKQGCWALDLGYSYYSGGTFILPSQIVGNDTELLGTQIGVKSLRGRLKANLLTITMRWFF